ncbi:hypothetical protein D9757_011809 [Collybiopsis confluens]|uniref:Uncharacterized protein n=1 Tax=Collybiopsis confluens TaxID=2823264 RepID=A0A8H5GGX3_9AGAR|nr:hypothetical protein D9757_011809 [Collybiopsis confluens]
MSTPNVRQIKATNHGPYDPILQIVSGGNPPYSLGPVNAGDAEAPYDLSEVKTLKEGEKFTVQVYTESDATAKDVTVLTYTKSSNHAADFQIAGTRIEPTLIYDGILSAD